MDGISLGQPSTWMDHRRFVWWRAETREGVPGSGQRSIDEAAARRGGGEDRGRGEDTHDGTCAAADRFGRSDMVGLALLALCTICICEPV